MNFKNISDSFRGIKIYEQKNLSELTTFKVGGPADLFIEVATVEELQKAILILQKENIPWMMIGKGSNLLVTDEGIDGAVIILQGDFKTHEILDSNRFYCGAGADLAEVSRIAATQNLTGLEFAVGIPGSFGGGIFMNAGAYDGELVQVIESVRWMDAEGIVQDIPKSDCNFAYRKSIFQKNGGVILGATVSLAPGKQEEIFQKMRELTIQRNTKQPLEWPSAGSTFKRPPGYFAGTLIQEAGLKGFFVGGAQVSEKHCGFMLNRNEATAEDVLNLIRSVRERVYEYANVWMNPEVRIIGRGKEKWQFLYETPDK